MSPSHRISEGDLLILRGVAKALADLHPDAKTKARLGELSRIVSGVVEGVTSEDWTPRDEPEMGLRAMAFSITGPVGNCDGSRHYAYDGSKEDGRGAKLAAVCSGCRACS